MTDVVSEQSLEPPCVPVTRPGQDTVEECEEPQGRRPPRLVDPAPLPQLILGRTPWGQHCRGSGDCPGPRQAAQAAVQLETEGACDAETKGPMHPVTLLSDHR